VAAGSATLERPGFRDRPVELSRSVRSYSSFTEAANENAVSRIYIGIHFRRAVEEGVRHGRQIAAYAVHQFMKPVR
jgi:hypothetical protein